MPKELARQISAIRDERKVSRAGLATLAGADRATVKALEDGGGTLASLTTVAAALGYYPSPFPSALANKRRWLGIGTRSLAAASRLSRPTLQTFESDGTGRVTTFESVCRALDEVPTLAKVEPTWWTPPNLVATILKSVKLRRFDLDPCSPPEPTVPTRRFLTEHDGGLWHQWNGAVFCNPPYDDVPRWLGKCSAEFEAKRATKIIALVPYRPETKAWKTLQITDATILVLHDRLRFGGRDYIAPSVSAFALWGLDTTEIDRLRALLPEHSEVVTAGNRRERAA